MKDIRRIAEEIVVREGGFVNDKDDPGGATKHGVTLGTLRRLGRDVTGDGRVTEADVRALSRDEAVKIFLRDYYAKPGIDRLPAVLRASVFDMYVNAGAHAVRILQRLLGEMGLTVAVDGIIGPQTERAAAQAYEMAPEHLADAYAIARRNYYFRLADARPASRKFVRTRGGDKGGWIRRAEEFMSERYRMSPREFQARVAQWG